MLKMNISIQLKKAQKLCQEHKFNLAKDIYEKILISWPNQIEALQNLSMIYIRQNDLGGAEKIFDKLYFLVQDKNTLINYSLLKLNLGKFTEVVKVSKENEHIDELKINAIRALRNLKKSQECLDLIQKYEEINKLNFHLIIEKTLVLNQLNQYKESIQLLQENFEKFMNNEDLFYINLGICYQNENQDIKAIESFKKIFKDSKFYTESQVQIGKSLSKLEQLEELEDLIKQQSDNTIRSSLLTFAAEVFYEQQNITKSLECYKSAINLNPENYDALTGTAELYLKEQKYDEGFDYWRWRVRKGLKLNKRFFVDDTEINHIDKFNKINLLAEQGIGDELFYIRLIQILPNKIREKVRLFVDQRLIEVIKENISDIEIFNIDEYKINNLSDEVTLNCGSLPRFIDINQKSLREIKKFEIKETFKLDRIGKRIGVSWISKNDQLEKFKSVSLSKIMESLPNDVSFQVLNLQYGDVSHEIAEINKTGRNDIYQAKYDLYNEISKLFELVSKCDVVITVCNFTAHVAGSLGIKTYVLIPKNKGRLWYWYGEKSDWYESVEYIHQSRDGDWDNVMKELSEKLRIKFS